MLRIQVVQSANSQQQLAIVVCHFTSTVRNGSISYGVSLCVITRNFAYQAIISSSVVSERRFVGVNDDKNIVQK